eukprot:366061-Chlamydomonas_euryale.AAC.16
MLSADELADVGSGLAALSTSVAQRRASEANAAPPPPPPRDWCSALVDSSVELLGDMRSSRLAALARALAQLRVVPGDAWVATLLQ